MGEGPHILKELEERTLTMDNDFGLVAYNSISQGVLGMGPLNYGKIWAINVATWQEVYNGGMNLRFGWGRATFPSIVPPIK